MDYRSTESEEQSPERTGSNLQASRAPVMTTAVYRNHQPVATSVTQSINSVIQTKTHREEHFDPNDNQNISESQRKKTATTVEQFELSSMEGGRSTQQQLQ